jgi:acetyl-CoA carboxylase biotin carboxylase subunit
MDAPDFRSGRYTTHFIENNLPFLLAEGDFDGKGAQLYEDVAVMVAFFDYQSRLTAKTSRWAPLKSSIWKHIGRRKANTEM